MNKSITQFNQSIKNTLGASVGRRGRKAVKRQLFTVLSTPQEAWLWINGTAPYLRDPNPKRRMPGHGAGGISGGNADSEPVWVSDLHQGQQCPPDAYLTHYPPGRQLAWRLSMDGEEAPWGGGVRWRAELCCLTHAWGEHKGNGRERKPSFYAAVTIHLP